MVIDVSLPMGNIANPAGTVNIKIIRDANNKITDVTYMTEAEAAELLDDMA